jgi:o-succinylbenzoate synthase
MGTARARADLAVELRTVRMPLRAPFRTSFGTDLVREILLVRWVEDDVEGWGECVADAAPLYSAEYVAGAAAVLRSHLVPRLFGASGVRAEGVAERLADVSGHRMAKAALEMAVLDAQLRGRHESLADYLGAVHDAVPAGVSVGIQDSLPQLLDVVGKFLDQGYQRIKLKIEPGWDVNAVAAVREAFGDIPLQVDANAAYSLADARQLARLDAFDLLMIEQPLHHEDVAQHAELQRRISTAICLDESIRSAADAEAALALGACRIVNIKQGRVGGVLEARRVHDVAAAAGVPVWCGGMLETGIGRATNLALAAMPNFRLPGDTSASRRYFDEDLTAPFELESDGTMRVPDGPGIGVDPDPARLEAVTRRIELVTEKE